MKLYIYTVLTIALFAFPAHAQTDKNKPDAKIKPDFSGTWVFDESKTKNIGYDLTLIVEHREPELKVAKKYNFKGAKKTDEQIYYTDGRATPNSTIGSDTISRKTEWRGALLIRTQQIIKTVGKTIAQTNTEKWELSADGKTLTLTLMESGAATVSQNRNSPIGQTSTISQPDTNTVLKFKRGE